MPVRARFLPRLLVSMLVVASASPVLGQSGAIGPAVQFLKARAASGHPGVAALGALAMLKAGVPPNDPALAEVIEKALSRSSSGSGGYVPNPSTGPDIYEAGVFCMMLASLDPDAYREQLEAAAAYLISKQKSNGAWDYDTRSGDTGDCSISQYALLGLWEAENAGVEVPPSVWERAARWYISVQRSNGGWNYHPDGPAPPTVSMTAAGTGSLLICKMQLAPYRRRQERPRSPLLIPVVPESDRDKYRVGLPEAQLDRAISGGINWLSRNFRPGDGSFGPSTYYGLYGCERVGALGNLPRFGTVDWYQVGVRYGSSTQKGDGSWQARFDAIPNTSWMVLFLSRATEKTLERIKIERLGSGTLLGGRGLPDNLNNLTVAQGRVVVRPMNGAIEEMLAILEDPRDEDDESALAGLMDRYFQDGPKSLRPYLDRFRVLLTEGTPDQRLTAAWALARTGELEIVPDLIKALEDPSEEVVATARYGLQLLSRRLEGFGPPPGADAEQKRQAAIQWRAWYESIRPPSRADRVPSSGG